MCVWGGELREPRFCASPGVFGRDALSEPFLTATLEDARQPALERDLDRRVVWRLRGPLLVELPEEPLRRRRILHGGLEDPPESVEITGPADVLPRHHHV